MTSELRTYWHLSHLKRKPSEYDICTSRLLFHKDRSFDLNLPASGWYRQFGQKSPLSLEDWEVFVDPRETTYSLYTEVQKEKEQYAGGLLRSMAERLNKEASMSPWMTHLELIIDPLRYPVHGLQMVAAYAGQMAPSGRIAITCLCQAADEIRRVQRLAYRLALHRERRPDVGQRGKLAWQNDAMWQPLRRLVERLLVTYDWGEALVALNLCVKPVFDELFGPQFAALCRHNQDELFATLLGSLAEDATWHQQWTSALIECLLAGPIANRQAIQTWMHRWDPEVQAVASALAPLWTTAPIPMEFERIWKTAVDGVTRTREALGLAGRAA